MSTADAIIYGLILLGALQGYRKGLISGLLSLVGNLLGLFIAGRHYGTAFAWLDQNTPLRSWLETFIYKSILPNLQAQAQLTQQQTLDKILALIPAELQSFVSKGVLPEVKAYTQNAIQSIAKTLSLAISENLMKLIAFFLIYLLVVLFFQAVAMVLLGSLGSFSGPLNRGGGLLFGTASVLIGLAVFVGLISPLVTLAGKDTFLAQIEKAQLYPYLLQIYEYCKDWLSLNLDMGLSVPFDPAKKSLPVFKQF